jgi:hypothetical protein
VSAAPRSGSAPARAIAAAVACGVSLGTASAVVAVQDPMRPTPGALGAPARSSAPVAAPAPAPVRDARDTPSPDAGAGAVPPQPREPLRLVSIRREQGAAHRALIGEQWVGLGDRIEGWRVTGVDAEEVRLQRGDEKVALRLWPSLRPTTSAEPTAAERTAAPAARPRTQR